MQPSLIDTAPGFDQPIAMLKHCHDRIRKQITTLEKLLQHLSEYGADVEAQQAAQAVLRYFNHAAELHHQDEEKDLLPLLQATAIGDDAMQLHSILPNILQEHQQMHEIWRKLDQQLTLIASGQSALLTPTDVTEFATVYHRHMQMEESMIAPMAKRLFSPAQTSQLGNAMRLRRGISES